VPLPREIPSPHDGEVGQGEGNSEERDNSKERAPLPNPLPARASQGEGAADCSDGGVSRCGHGGGHPKRAVRSAAVVEDPAAARG